MSASGKTSSHSWEEKLAKGKRGEQVVLEWLHSHGHRVQDVRDDPFWQQLDVDLLVNDRWVEVKTDYRATDCLFLEFQALTKSRADYWFYYTPQTEKLYCFRHSVLHDALRLAWYRGDKVHTIVSMNGPNTWEVQGIVVPLANLKGKEWQL